MGGGLGLVSRRILHAKADVPAPADGERPEWLRRALRSDWRREAGYKVRCVDPEPKGNRPRGRRSGAPAGAAAGAAGPRPEVPMPLTLRHALRALGALLLVGACVVPGASWAGGRRHRPRPRPPLELDERAFDIVGELVAPGCTLRAWPPRRVGNPLIFLPVDFNAEVLESLDEIK